MGSMPKIRQGVIRPLRRLQDATGSLHNDPTSAPRHSADRRDRRADLPRGELVPVLGASRIAHIGGRVPRALAFDLVNTGRRHI